MSSSKALDSEKHFEHLEKLLELEEAEEVEQFREYFLSKTPEERELTGQALLRLAVDEIHFNPAGRELISLRYADKRPIPLYSPDSGNVVTLSPSSSFVDNAFGTVYEKNQETITVAFDRRIPGWFTEEGVYDLNIAGNRATYKKMFETLRQVREAEHNRLAYFRDLSLGLKKTASYDDLKIEKIPFYNQRLNRWQKEAAAKAMAAKDIFIIHGPPGTGKTTVLIEIIRQAISQNQFALATAPSNTACDNLLESLVKAGVNALRLGHPARIMEHLRDHTLDFKLAHHPLAKAADAAETELDRLYRQRGRRRDRGSLPRDLREDFAERIAGLKAEVKNLESKIFREIVTTAPVMIATHSGASHPIFLKRPVDLLVMDEASQATEPSSWIPIRRTKKIILAGDHLQLPPTVLSKKAEEKGLAKTLFERVHRLVGADGKSLLRVQYRMNEKIMNFSSREFYKGELIADKSVCSHTLADLPHVKKVAASEEVFLFLDTAGRGFEEALEPGSESRYNREEAVLVIRHLENLLQLGVKPEEIAVISPYSAQVRLLASLIANLDIVDIEVDSVDGFQGREKEAVILSLVRSNDRREVGFLSDTRRMNVGMTRARRLLIVLGDSGTLSRHPFYLKFIEYSDQNDAHRSAWEWIS